MRQIFQNVPQATQLLITRGRDVGISQSAKRAIQRYPQMCCVSFLGAISTLLIIRVTLDLKNSLALRGRSGVLRKGKPRPAAKPATGNCNGIPEVQLMFPIIAAFLGFYGDINPE